MYELDAVNRFVPTSRQLSVIAAKRHAVLAGLKQRDDLGTTRTRRRSWYAWRLWRLIVAARVT